MSDRESEMLEVVREAEANDRDDSKFVKPKAPREPAQVYSVRIPVERLEQLRRIAVAMSTPPSTMIRMWVLERLDQIDTMESSQGSKGAQQFRIPLCYSIDSVGSSKQRSELEAWIREATHV